MAKIINIDDKLSFDTNPVIQVKGEKLEVNADAETMLKMMGAFKNKSEIDAAMEAYELMFSKEDRQKIGKLKLPFKDLMVIIEEAMKLVQGVDEPGGRTDPYYDLIDDFDLIISSFQTQYGIRLSREMQTMKWDEFRDLLVGIGPETPLGRIVSIRSETDKDRLKYFTKEQHRIRNEWKSRQIKQMSVEDRDAVLEQIKQAFISMAGGGKN